MKKYVLCLSGIVMAFLSYGDAQDNGDDTGAGATPLVVSTSMAIHGPHTLATNDLADWFSFDLKTNTLYRFESTGSWDVRAELFSDSNGTVSIIENDDSGDLENFQLLVVPTVEQTYYLKVDNYYGGYAEYALEFQAHAVLDDWDPADDIYSNAPTLIVSETEQVHGSHNLSDGDTEDWFHIFLLQGVEYTFRAVNTGWDTVGELYDNNLLLVDGGDDDYDPSDIDNKLNFIITHTPTVTGDYYLRVIGYKVGDLNYSLVYNSTAPDTDGDGMSDSDEYIAGTDPTNPASFFAITNGSAGSFVVGWPSVSNREYSVYWTDNLTNAFQFLPPKVGYPVNSFTDLVHGADNAGFYKVKVQLKP